MPTRRSTHGRNARRPAHSLGQPRLDHLVREVVQRVGAVDVAQQRFALGLVPARRSRSAPALAGLGAHQVAGALDRQVETGTASLLARSSRVLVRLARGGARRTSAATRGGRPPATPASAVRLDPRKGLSAHAGRSCPQDAPTSSADWRETGVSRPSSHTAHRILSPLRLPVPSPPRIELDAVASPTSAENGHVRSDVKERAQEASGASECPQDAPSVGEAAQVIHRPECRGRGA